MILFWFYFSGLSIRFIRTKHIKSLETGASLLSKGTCFLTLRLISVILKHICLAGIVILAVYADSNLTMVNLDQVNVIKSFDEDCVSVIALRRQNYIYLTTAN